MKKPKKISLLLGVGLATAVVAVASAAPGGDPRGLDSDGDGLITAEELAARNAALIEAADADGDGAISKEEMKSHREKKRAEMRAKRNPDKNGDGVVSYAEFQDAANARFERLDKNGDGVIDEDEQKKHRRGHGPRGGR